MYNEGTPAFFVDQGICYPTPINCGYYYTGFEAPGEWDGQHQFLDAQQVQYMGGQMENYPHPYYYNPGFEYTQPYYNPYDPYASDAVVGSDASQVYVAAPLYDDYVSPAPYYHNAVQPSNDIFHNHALGNTTSASMPSRVKQTLSSASAPFTMISTNPTPKHANHSQDKPKEIDALPQQSHMNDRGNKGALQASNKTSNDPARPFDKQLKPTPPVGGALSNPRNGVYQSAGVKKISSGYNANGYVKNLTADSNIATNQNWAQPIYKLDQQLVVKSFTTKAGSVNTDGNIIIDLGNYNKADFPIDYTYAKFFVIKSYSEDDVHKSIKYNVWSSTPNGNKKLDKAYEDAQRVAQKDHHNCPVFLFFSVNASGNFCGVAEMIGRVDFHKDMDFWQQDKWSGSFPVKWHIVKDVPNAKFRHITLENNENNPVTYSRDTQEVMLGPGLEVLKIFKAHVARASLLEDIMYYESREKFMHEERAKQPPKRFGGQAFISALDPPPPRKLKYIVGAPSAKDDKVINQQYQSCSKEVSAPRVPYQAPPVDETTDASKINSEPDGGAVATLKIGSLNISSEEAKSSVVPAPKPASSDSESTIRVGSMHVKINGLKKSSSPKTPAEKNQDARQQKMY